jgi:hypothetical protein
VEDRAMETGRFLTFLEVTVTALLLVVLVVAALG